jgi:hypothetical protein
MRRNALLGILVLLAGCAAFEGPQSTAGHHTLCYTRLATSAAEVHTLAKDACGGSEPRFEKQEMDLSACPLLVPERVYFRCGG